MPSHDFVKYFRFTAILILWGMIGAFLRLHLITDQVLLDDEWHGLFYATGHPLAYLLRYTTADATCAPLNAYAWILLHTTGWSEIGLRLPSLVPGLLALVILPLLVRRIHGEAAACIFATFLAFSPFLTFYSRIFRPYSALAFLEFIAIYSAGIWLYTGEKRFRWLCLFTSAAALYFHPVAAIGILAPWAVAGVLYFWSRKTKPGSCIPNFRPGWRSVMLTAGLVVSMFALTVQPTVIAENMVPGSPLAIDTLKQFLMMLFGTSSVMLAGGLTLMCLLGAWTLFREHFFWGAVFALTAFLHLLMIVVCRFAGIEAPIVLARYLTILFPLAHVCAAVGLIQCAARISGLTEFRKPPIRKLSFALAILVFASWILTNPLWYAYAAPNNFTNHSAFIESGQFGGWDKPYRSWFLPQSVSSDQPRMSAFYRGLPQRTRRLIEYPMMLGDHFNYYYFYQHYHGKQIIIGYTDIVGIMPLNRDCIYPDYFVNHVIRAVDDRRGIRFGNMVDILDAEAVRRSRADYLICHKDLLGEFLPGIRLSAKTLTPGLKECVEQSTKHFGPPVFEDETIVVFGVADSPPPH